jgi:hypothetical protein
MPYPMGVHETLEAWQQGGITYRRALRLLGVDTIADLYDAARSSGVMIRREPSPAEVDLADRASAMIGRQLGKVVDAAVAAPGLSL